MSTSLKEHVSPLHESFLNEFIAEFGRFARLPASRQEYPTLLVLNGHEICRNLYVHHVGAVAVSPEIVHEEVVRVVNEEVQGIEHVAVVLEDRDFQGGLHDLLELVLGLLPVMNEFDALLLVLFPE